MKFNWVRKIMITSAQQFYIKFLLRIKKLCGEIIVNRIHMFLRKLALTMQHLDVSSTYSSERFRLNQILNIQL